MKHLQLSGHKVGPDDARVGRGSEEKDRLLGLSAYAAAWLCFLSILLYFFILILRSESVS